MLELKNVQSGYGQIQVLRNLSLSVQEAEIVTLIGANGAGKTTTLKTIMGVLKPVSGEITFNGEAIHHRSPHEIVRRGIAICPEGRRIFPTLSVAENLHLGGLYTPPAKYKKILSEVYHYFPILKEREQQLAGTLSGGEQQMLAMARALMANPKILLLDEPSLGLSPILVEKIFEIIPQINARGISILLVEQNAMAALSIAHRGYVLETGSIFLEGQAAELLANRKIKEAYLGGAR